MFHDLAGARAALEAGHRVLVTPAGGVAYAGEGFYRAVVAALRDERPEVPFEAVLDCGDDGALALDAVAAGWRRIVLRPQRLRAKVSEAAAPYDAAILARRPPRAVDRGYRAPATKTAPRPSQEGHRTMRVTRKVKQILANYESDNPGTKANLCRILSHGRLGGTGRMVILPVDQGFEHGPARSFAPNPPAYDPHYHFQLAIDAGLNAYAAPLGMLEAGADSFAGAIPTILKMNSANSLASKTAAKDQAITASISDALRLGCSAVGFTIYPGSDSANDMIEEVREHAEEAKSVGLATVVWSYPRGGDLTKDGETAMDVDAYATQIAALIGAHIIKVKLPTDHLAQAEAKAVYQKTGVDISSMAARVKHIMDAAFGGRRIVVFSGGTMKGEDALFDEAKAIRDGGGNGSIIGRNSFQRPREDAMKLLDRIVAIYQGKEE